MAFIDEAKLKIKAGHGGDGVVRWRKEKYKPMAGPGGGNGGNGGNVYAETVSDLAYLEFYRHKKDFSAQDGQPGGNFGKEGANGKDLILKFPRGTLLINLDTDTRFDLNEIGEKVLILKGGRGGLGNEHFKSSTNRSPQESTPGKPGEKAKFSVELRLFADVGLIGLPSAGKSTLLNTLTDAESKVAEYHFTTLEPHLGVMGGGIVLADIPGLISGASEGKGLGHKFLRHIKRTKTLAHLISLESEDLLKDYEVIREELKKYDEGLLIKKEIIILSKSDLASEEFVKEQLELFKKQFPDKSISAISVEDEKSIKALAKELVKLSQD